MYVLSLLLYFSDYWINIKNYHRLYKNNLSTFRIYDMANVKQWKKWNEALAYYIIEQTGKSSYVAFSINLPKTSYTINSKNMMVLSFKSDFAQGHDLAKGC